MPIIEPTNSKAEIKENEMPSRKDRQYDAVLKEKMTSLEDKCCYCDGSLLDKDGKVKPDVTYDKDGGCHNTCRLSFKSARNLQLCIIMNSWSIGDTVTLTPLIREIKRLYPFIAIDIITLIPEIFKYNKNIRRIIKYDKKLTRAMLTKYDHVMEPFQPTNPNFLQHWTAHSVDFITHGGMKKTIDRADWWYEVPYTDIEKEYMKKICVKDGLDPDVDSFILVHPHKAEWPTRTWSSESWTELISKIKKEHPHYKIVGIGGSRDEYADHTMKNYMKQEGIIDLYNKLTVLETLALMDKPKAKMLITVDTAPLHIAACAKEILILGIFTVVRSKFRAPVRNGVFGYKFKGVDISECSCTNDLKFFSEAIGFMECPKKKLLTELFNSLTGKGSINFTKENVLTALDNHSISLGRYTDKWSDTPDVLANQVFDELKIYSKKLPCHPTAEQVYKEFVAFIDSYTKEGDA